jgi:hypothetical protein
VVFFSASPLKAAGMSSVRWDSTPKCMQMAMKVSFHVAKLSVPANLSMESKLPPEEEEESDNDMVLKEEREGER